MYAVGLGIVSMFTLAFMISQLGQFHGYWVARHKEYRQAFTFHNSDNCNNPMLKSQLGSFNLCDTAEQILSQYPLFSAIHDVAQDMHLCGHNRCGIFYLDITANLHKVVIGCGLLAILGLYVSRRLMQDNQRHSELERYRLPSYKNR
tara:strand:+ start:587 stop:1027 length:441 start_codon:yes stop_codon:yes gene_type:complete